MSSSSRVLRVCALLALPTGVFAQSTRGPTVFSPAAQVGTVNLRAAIVLQDYTVKPLPLLKVVALRNDRPDSVFAQTDLDGRSALELSVGVYTVRARTPQPIGGRMYEWALRVIVRPQQTQSVDLTNSNASRSDSVATAPTVVAEAKPAPPPPAAAPQPTPAQSTATAAAVTGAATAAVVASAQPAQPKPTQAKAAQAKPAQAKSTPSTTAQPKTTQSQPVQPQPVTAQSTTPQSTTPQSTAPQSTAPKTVASQPAPAPATPTKASAPPKADAAVATTAAKSTTPAKSPAPATATPPTSGDKAVVVAKSEPTKPASTAAPAPATQSPAPVTSVKTAQATPLASASSTAPVAKPVDAATPRPRRTHTSGLMLGLSFDASSIRSNDLNSTTESGPGIAGIIGWGITKNIALALDMSGAQISSVDGNYNLGHADIGARWHFVNRTSFVPFVDVGYAGRALMKRDVTLTDALGNTSTGTLTYMGAGLSYGGGLNYYITPGIAFGGAFKWTTGRFSQVRFENLTVEDLQLDASSARFNMGFTWYPIGRK